MAGTPVPGYSTSTICSSDSQLWSLTVRLNRRATDGLGRPRRPVDVTGLRPPGFSDTSTRQAACDVLTNTDMLGEVHGSVVNTWANLVPITARMNLDTGQDPFAVKRLEYQGSMYASTRAVGALEGEWTRDALAERGQRIAEWAVGRWPH
jgi:hypothetical protein